MRKYSQTFKKNVAHNFDAKFTIKSKINQKNNLYIDKFWMTTNEVRLNNIKENFTENQFIDINDKQEIWL